MDFPVITKAALKGNTLHLEGYVGSAPNQSLFGNSTIEIFISDNDPSGYGEGKTYLGTLTADANANFNTDITVAGLKVGDKITSTATDKDGNTSEFSGNVEIASSPNIPPTITITQPPDKDVTASGEYLICWEDADPDDNADITLYWDKDKNKENNTSDTQGREWGVIASGIKEDPEGKGDSYLLDLSTIPSWCPWTRYFYVLGKIADPVNPPVYDYGEGKVTIITKASSGGTTKSASGAAITIPAKALSMNAYVIINDKPNKPEIDTANRRALNDKNLNLTNLDKTIYEFKAISIFGDVLTIASTKEPIKTEKTTITIPYLQEVKTKEKGLRIFYLNERKGEWTMVETKQEVNKEANTVSAQVSDFGTYRLMEVISLQTSEISHYPNPLKLNKTKEITFIDLPTTTNAKIKIYNQVGEEIKTISVTSEKMTWNLYSDKGKLIASGIYFYLVIDDKGVKHRGKMAVVR